MFRCQAPGKASRMRVQPPQFGFSGDAAVIADTAAFVRVTVSPNGSRISLPLSDRGACTDASYAQGQQVRVRVRVRVQVQVAHWQAHPRTTEALASGYDRWRPRRDAKGPRPPRERRQAS